MMAMPMSNAATKPRKPRRVALACCWQSAKAANTAPAKAHRSHKATTHNLFGSATITKSYPGARSEEHTSELQSQSNLVCRLLLEKKKKQHRHPLPRLPQRPHVLRAVRPPHAPSSP